MYIYIYIDTYMYIYIYICGAVYFVCEAPGITINLSPTIIVGPSYVHKGPNTGPSCAQTCGQTDAEK